MTWRPTTALGVAAIVAVAAGAHGEPGQPPKNDSSGTSDFDIRVDYVAAKVAKLRGLPLRSVVQRGIVSRAELEKRIRKDIGTGASLVDLRAEEVFLKRFGLLASQTDYVELATSLLTSEIAGFYDPKANILFVPAGAVGAANTTMVIAHEVDHALQDQHFNLDAFTAKRRGNSDARLARLALVEGDGTAVMLEYQFAESGASPPWANDALMAQIRNMLRNPGDEAAARAPVFVRELLVFPYLEGLSFVAHVRRHKPWSTIDKMFSKPPLSTEHILHPAKYTAYEAPVAVTTPAALGGDLRRYNDVLGEFGLRAWLMHHGVLRSRAAEAAWGWGGDRASVYVGDTGRTVGVISTVWDSTIDAEEFYDAAVFAVGAMAGGKAVSGGLHSIVFGGGAALVRRGDKVIVVVGAGEPLKIARELVAKTGW